MYGIRRTLAKSLYKIDNKISYFFLKLLYNFRVKKKNRIVFVGLGNHGFTLLAFFVSVVAKQKISVVIDPSKKAKKLANNVLCCKYYTNIETAIHANDFYGDLAYIASDHQSHTDHAISASNYFKKIYIEKPLFVNHSQQKKFKEIILNKDNIFTGFNRPQAKFFREFISKLSNNFFISIIINGHNLPSNHWYRNKGQGSRVLGNLTHWIDLSTHIFMKHGLSKTININLSKGDLDDLIVVLTCDNSIINLCFSANCEPVDGVEEFIYWNDRNSIGKIDNFKKIEYKTNKGYLRKKSNYRKDVGHKSASLLPMQENFENILDIHYISSSLALKIEDMYVNEIKSANFKLKI